MTTHRLISYLVNSMQRIYANTVIVDEQRGMKRYRMNAQLTRLMATSRDFDEREWAWTTWHDVVGRQVHVGQLYSYCSHQQQTDP